MLIDSVDLTANLLEQDWSIENNAFGILDNAKFNLDDPTKTLSVVRGKEVLVENFYDNTERFFGGVLTEVTGTTHGVGRRLECRALDWTFILKKAIVAETYRGKSDQYIISEAVATPKGIFESSDTDLSDFDFSTTNVDIGKANTQFHQFKRDTISDAMDSLADGAGFVWRVDAFQRIFFKAFGSEGHAFSLSDNPDDVSTFAYMGLKQHFDISKVVNSVTVEGAFLRELFADIVEEDRIFASDGTEVQVSARYMWQARETQTRIQVFRNTGTDGTPVWTEQTVGLAGKDTLVSHNVLWDPVVRTLQWATAPPNFANSFRVDGDRLRGLIHKDVSQSSIDTFGREYGHSIKDVSIVSDEQVISRVEAELRKRAGEAERITLRTTKDGIIAGKVLLVVDAILGVNASYLVEKLVMRLKGGTLAEYQLTLRAFVT